MKQGSSRRLTEPPLHEDKSGTDPEHLYSPPGPLWATRPEKPRLAKESLLAVPAECARRLKALLGFPVIVILVSCGLLGGWHRWDGV